MNMIASHTIIQQADLELLESLPECAAIGVTVAGKLKEKSAVVASVRYVEDAPSRRNR